MFCLWMLFFLPRVWILPEIMCKTLSVSWPVTVYWLLRQILGILTIYQVIWQYWGSWIVTSHICEEVNSAILWLKWCSHSYWLRCLVMTYRIWKICGQVTCELLKPVLLILFMPYTCIHHLLQVLVYMQSGMQDKCI